MKDFKWYDWMMLGFLVLFAIVGALMSPWGQALLGSDAAPAWIQAIGSVLAIVVAIWISRSQYNRDRALERKRKKDSLGAALVLTQRSRFLVNECLTVDDYDYFESDESLYDAREFEQVAAALRSVPVHEFPPNAVLAVMSAAQSAAQAIRAVEAVREVDADAEWERPVASEWLASLRDRLDRAAEAIQKEIDIPDAG